MYIHVYCTCIDEEAVELWKEGGNAKGREGEAVRFFSRAPAPRDGGGPAF